MIRMTMKRSRLISALLALLTILCGAALTLFPRLPSILTVCIAVLAILLAFSTVFVIVKWHRCPHCGKFIPITARPKECLYCEQPIQ